MQLGNPPTMPVRDQEVAAGGTWKVSPVSTPRRPARRIAIFKEATRLEIDFLEMDWRAGQHVE